MNENLFVFAPAKPPELLSPLALAYLGDAVYETFIRQYLLSLPNHRPNHLHRQAVRFVSAKAQAKALQIWLPLLSEQELEILKRGRNAKSRSMPKNANMLDYRQSTGFECLIGYLYCSGQHERLQSLLLKVIEHLNHDAGGQNDAAKTKGR